MLARLVHSKLLLKKQVMNHVRYPITQIKNDQREDIVGAVVLSR